jgi:hypothetical protein
MILRVPCSRCGAQILPDTANRNGGVCTPCKGGFRKNIEKGKKNREQQREFENSAERKYWLALVNLVFETPQGIANLNHPEKTYYAVKCLVGDVYNGGFEQYFFNTSGDLYCYAIDGLHELGAENSVNLLLKAKEVLFGSAPVPIDQLSRRSIMITLADDSGPTFENLSLLDAEFWKDPDQLAEKCEGYARRHKLYGNA